MKKEHKISWLNVPGYIPETVNHLIGCTKVSAGCDNCYAENMAKRLAKIKSTNQYSKVVGEFGWNKQVEWFQPALDKIETWKKPRAIFMPSMGDMFHNKVRFESFVRTLEVIQAHPEHLFIVITKRPQNAVRYFEKLGKAMSGGWPCDIDFLPVPNLWIGVSAENQEEADRRIPLLLEVPAVKRFVSIEPMLGPVDFRPFMYEVDALDVMVVSEKEDLSPHDAAKKMFNDKPEAFYPSKNLDWVIVGGESGSKARPVNPYWVRIIRDQCKDAGTPFFFKQWGNQFKGDELDGRQHHEFPKL